jgi:HK97 family phage portal protein
MEIAETAEPVARTFAITRTALVKGSTATAPTTNGLFRLNRLPAYGAAREALAIPAFYGGVKFISRTVARLPKRVNQTTTDADGNTTRKRVTHPVTALISQQPNNLYNAIYLWATALGHALMYGNGYIWVERRMGKPIALHNLHAMLVVPYRSGGQQWYALRQWDGSNVRDGGGNALSIPAADMLHIANFSEDGEAGLSVLDLLADSLGLARVTERFLANYFEEGSVVNIVVEADKGLKQADVDTLRYGIETTNRGIENSHNTMILSGATAKNLTPPIKDFAYEVLKAASVQDIANMLRLDPTMLYTLDKATWGNLEQFKDMLVTYTFAEWVDVIELECNTKLFGLDERAAGYYVKISTDQLTRGDFNDTVGAINGGLATGLFNSNEGRELLGLDPRPGGDVYYSPQNAPISGNGPADDADETDGDGNADPDPQAAPNASLDPTAVIADATPLEAVGGSALASVEVSRGEQLRQTFGRFLAAAADRVRRKQVKAFGRERADPSGWLRTFADEQATMLADELNPFVETAYLDPTDRAFALQMVVEDYSALVMRAQAAADPDDVIDAMIERLNNGTH